MIDQGDHVNAGQLYGAAAGAYSQVALYWVGLGYCAAEGGRMDESVMHHRRAVELEPHSRHSHLNDLGYSLMEAGQYDEAEEVLQRAGELAPPDYDLAKGGPGASSQRAKRSAIVPIEKLARHERPKSTPSISRPTRRNVRVILD